MENTSLNTSPKGRNAFKLGLVTENLNHLMGQILTVVDASTDGDKNKAMKDLIREKVSLKHQWFCDMAWRQEETEGSGHSPRDVWEDDLVPFEESKKHSFK